MTCQDARALFSAWLDRAMTVEERRQCEAHLAGCAECRHELERFRQTISVLHAVEPERAPAGFVDRVLEQTRPSWPRRLARWLFVPLPVKLPLEAAAMALVGVLAFFVIRDSPELEQISRAPSPFPPRLQAPRADEQEGTAPPMTPAPRALERDSSPSEHAVTPEALRKTPEAPRTTPEAPRRQDEVARSRGEGPAPEPSRPRAKEAASPPAPAPAPTPARAPASEPAGNVERRARAEQAADATALRAARAPSVTTPVESSRIVSGRLTVSHRDAATRALAALVTELNGSVLSRADTAETTTVEIVIPGSAYADLGRGLARIGAWSPDSRLRPGPDQLHVTLRIAN